MTQLCSVENHEKADIRVGDLKIQLVLLIMFILETLSDLKTRNMLFSQSG